MQQANEYLKRLLREDIEAAREIYLNCDEAVGESAKESAEMDQALIEQTKRLLNSTQTILTNQSEIARLNGENFNVFRLLDLEHKEVKLHSRFIAGLIDPKGSHDQGPVFLQMFLQQVKEDWRIEASHARVKQEHYIGNVNISGANSTGGSIDIFITDGTRHISIENKIWYGEGDHQVNRYGNYEPCKNFVLFLTLEGDEAKTCRTNYKPISYRCHITPWLENCHRYCTDLPILRETIKQYIHTIKNLTGGLIMQKANEDLKDLIRKNIKAAGTIYLGYDVVIGEAIREFVKKLEERIKEDPNSDDWKIKNTIENRSAINWKGLEIENDKWPKIGKIKWQYCNADLNYEYGFSDPDRKFRDKIKEKMGENVNGLSFDPHRRWWAFLKKDNTNDLKELFDEKERDDLVKQIAFELIDFIKACDSKLGGSDASQPS